MPQSNMFGDSKLRSNSARSDAASKTSSTSTVSSSPLAVDSSILSETLSNIDDILELEAGSSSDSDSTPMVPWNMRAGTRNEGGNTMVTQTYSLANNIPHLSHMELRNKRGGRRRHRGINEKGERAQKQGTAAIPVSRDFFLLIALCIGLACALICLGRPLVASMLWM